MRSKSWLPGTMATTAVVRLRRRWRSELGGRPTRLLYHVSGPGRLPCFGAKKGLSFKDDAEKLRHRLRHRGKRDRPARERGERGHHGRVEPARIDPGEARKVSRHVECEAMHRHPPPYSNPDRRQLSPLGPHAGITGAPLPDDAEGLN